MQNIQPLVLKHYRQSFDKNVERIIYLLEQYYNKSKESFKYTSLSALITMSRKINT